MPKKIRNTPIEIAYNIVASKNNGEFVVKDRTNNTNLDPRNINDKIKIYERQVLGWFIEPAEILVNDDKNGFIVLMICLSYLEGVEIYKYGTKSKGKSKSFFVSALNRIYPKNFIEEELGDLYIEARCGLFHNGMIKGKTVISYDYDDAINFVDSNTIKINPKLLLKDIKKDFLDFIAYLKLNNEAQMLFDRMFSNIAENE